MKKLFLLDAYALIYRAYYAFISNPRINSRGENTSAVFGFVKTLDEVLKKEKPDYIAVAFDLACETFRTENFSEYKAQRQPAPEDIHRSVPIIREILKAYRIPIVEAEGYEADDVIGTLSQKAVKEGVEVYMMTPDKDYVQLVGEHVFIYKVGTKGKGYETWGEKEVKEKYGLSSPKQMIDLLGLMGDASDNISGCPGVGEKTALKLLEEYGSIDNLLEHKEELKGALQKKITEGEEKIRFSQFLATIILDVPVEFDRELFRVKPHDEVRKNELFKALEFNSMVNRSVEASPSSNQSAFDFSEPQTETPLAEEAPEEHTQSLETSHPSYHLLKTDEEVEKFLHILLKKRMCAFALEDASFSEKGRILSGLALCAEKGKAGYIPFPEQKGERMKKLSLLKPLLENEEVLKIGGDIKNELNTLKSFGIDLKGKKFDPTIARYLLDPDLPHNLEDMASSLLHYQIIRKEKEENSLLETSEKERMNYVSERADVLFQLYEKLDAEIKNSECASLFYDVEMPLAEVLADMEWKGVRIDRGNLNNLSLSMSETMDRLTEEIYALAGGNFKIDSPKQVGEVLFERLQLSEKPPKTKTGQYQTNEETLEKLRGKHPIVEKILEYRGIKKLLSTYILALPNLVNPQTGHIHTSFNQTITATGRLSCSNPNLQNIPVREEQGRLIRSAFIPDEGEEFFSADYSQIELRLMAHLSQDPGMLDAFNKNLDVHADTASKIYKVPLEEVTPEMRRKAKTANFGIIYGISPFGLSERLNIPRGEAKELIDNYFLSYPHIKDYTQRTIEEAKTKGYVETLFHRRRYIPDIHSRNQTVRGYAERNAINTPVQGTAADIIKIAMVRIFQRFKELNLKSKMLLQVHDELDFSVLPTEKEIVKQVVVEEMEHAVSLSVPLVVDCAFGKNWLEAH